MPAAWRHFLDRLWQIFGRDLWSLCTFAPVVWRSILTALDDLGSSERRREVVVRFAEQVLKAFSRGLIQVLILGVLLQLGAASIGKVTGNLGRPLIESYVLLIFVRDVLPLALAAFIVLRQGAALTTKYAFASLEPPPAPPDDPVRDLMPYVVSGVVSGAAFFVVLAGLFLRGYLLGGPFTGSTDLGVFDAMLGPTLRAGFSAGLLKAALFGLVVVYVSLALGWEAGRPDREEWHREHRHYRHYFVWEAASISLSACALLTVLFWQSLTGSAL